MKDLCELVVLRVDMIGYALSIFIKRVEAREHLHVYLLADGTQDAFDLCGRGFEGLTP
jgi:hypothetical protein